MQKIITIRETQNPDILNDTNLHPILKRIYLKRNIKDKIEIDNQFKHLLHYQDLSDINIAVERLYIALEKKENILIVGDYDVDGATSTALLVKTLKNFGATNINFFVPDRFKYGYGLSKEIIFAVKDSFKPTLIITVDNGITSSMGVACANENNINVIITDHHLPGNTLPDAIAIINPNKPKDNFKSKNIAGVGVAFYLMLALRAKLRTQNWFNKNNIAEYSLLNVLDLVALGTVSDMVVLDHNNRILVHNGMRHIRANNCCFGIKALLDKKDISATKITDLTFIVAPRLNAAGRLEDMALGIYCLLADDLPTAKKLAQQLQKLNTQRRKLEEQMQKEAEHYLENYKFANDKLPLGLCLHNENWHQGIIGILASRIKEQTHSPVIAFANHDDEFIKGSARSIEKVHIRDVLAKIDAENPTLIEKFGGHAMAAGLTLRAKNYSSFNNLFIKEIKNILTSADLHETIITDGALNANELTSDLINILQGAGPWGNGFPEPIFCGNFYILDQRIIGQKHLKLTLEYQDKIFDAIYFKCDLKLWPNFRITEAQIAYIPDENEYLNQKKIQLIVKHIVPLI